MLIQFIGIFIGVLLRTFVPALRKMEKTSKKDKEWKWNHAYTATAITSTFISIIATLLIFPSIEIIEVNALMAFTTGFSQGFGFNSLINEMKEWIFG